MKTEWRAVDTASSVDLLVYATDMIRLKDELAHFQSFAAKQSCSILLINWGKWWLVAKCKKIKKQKKRKKREWLRRPCLVQTRSKVSNGFFKKVLCTSPFEAHLLWNMCTKMSFQVSFRSPGFWGLVLCQMSCLEPFYVMFFVIFLFCLCPTIVCWLFALWNEVKCFADCETSSGVPSARGRVDNDWFLFFFYLWLNCPSNRLMFVGYMWCFLLVFVVVWLVVGVRGVWGIGYIKLSKAVQSLIVFHFFLLFTVRSGVKPTPTERGLWSCCVFAALLKDTSAWWTGALLTSSFSKSNHQSLILFLVLENAFLLKLQWSHFLCHHISPWAVSRHLANQITCKWMLLKPSPLFTLASVRLLQLLSLMLNTLGWADVVLTSPPEIREELSFLPVCKATPTVPAGCLPLALCPVWWMPRPQC